MRTAGVVDGVEHLDCWIESSWGRASATQVMRRTPCATQAVLSELRLQSLAVALQGPTLDTSTPDHRLIN